MQQPVIPTTANGVPLVNVCGQYVDLVVWGVYNQNYIEVMANVDNDWGIVVNTAETNNAVALNSFHPELVGKSLGEMRERCREIMQAYALVFGVGIGEPEYDPGHIW